MHARQVLCNWITSPAPFLTADEPSFLSFFYILSFFTFTHTCIHCLGHPPPRPLLGRTCSTLLFSDFVEEIAWDNKKDIAFLLLWDKDSCTEGFLTLLPCTCVLEATVIHLYQTSSLISSTFPIVVFASLRLLYSFLYSEHINHIQVFGFLPFPIPPICILPLVCDPCSTILLHLFLVYNLHPATKPLGKYPKDCD
jgi:hypothetical protein